VNGVQAVKNCLVQDRRVAQEKGHLAHPVIRMAMSDGWVPTWVWVPPWDHEKAVYGVVHVIRVSKTCHDFPALHMDFVDMLMENDSTLDFDQDGPT
jgi:hypothetical protein